MNLVVETLENIDRQLWFIVSSAQSNEPYNAFLSGFLDRLLPIFKDALHLKARLETADLGYETFWPDLVGSRSKLPTNIIISENQVISDDQPESLDKEQIYECGVTLFPGLEHISEQRYTIDCKASIACEPAAVTDAGEAGANTGLVSGTKSDATSKKSTGEKSGGRSVRDPSVASSNATTHSRAVLGSHRTMQSQTVSSQNEDQTGTSTTLLNPLSHTRSPSHAKNTHQSEMPSGPPGQPLFPPGVAKTAKPSALDRPKISQMQTIDLASRRSASPESLNTTSKRKRMPALESTENVEPSTTFKVRRLSEQHRSIRSASPSRPSQDEHSPNFRRTPTSTQVLADGPPSSGGAGNEEALRPPSTSTLRGVARDSLRSPEDSGKTSSPGYALGK